MNIKPLYACFELTSRCNLNCEFCYSSKNIPELNIKDIKKVIRKIKNFGVKQIVFSGGEPLLRKEIKEILRFSKESGLATCLSTNGILLTKQKIKELQNYVDWVGLSLDGVDQETDSLMRGPNHFSRAIEVLNNLNNTNIKVKINTMVGKPNIGRIEKMGDFLNKFDCVKIWKLMQYTYKTNSPHFNPRGISREKFEITKTNFSALVKKINKNNYNFTLGPMTKEQRSNVCLLIQANGDIMIPSGEICLFLGNILKTDLGQVLDENNFKIAKHRRLAKISYKLNK